MPKGSKRFCISIVYSRLDRADSSLLTFDLANPCVSSAILICQTSQATLTWWNSDKKTIRQTHSHHLCLSCISFSGVISFQTSANANVLLNCHGCNLDLALVYPAVSCRQRSVSRGHFEVPASLCTKAFSSFSPAQPLECFSALPSEHHQRL